uniref:Uncharacterized protein ORF3 n=1 Tax=Sapovirus Hu/Ehime/04-1680/2004/JP TaxID=382651 RepID=A0P9K7_9CALI|nr:hypothetical protein [Sapovirus Hu/Ehime/04-1680/2004/JP]
MAPPQVREMVQELARKLIHLARLVQPHPVLLFLIRINPMGPRSAWRWLLLLDPSNRTSLTQYATALQSIALLLGMIECPRELILDLFHFTPTLIRIRPISRACGRVGVAVSRCGFRSLVLVSLQAASLLLSSRQGLTRPQSVILVSCHMLLSTLVLWNQFHS